MSLPRTRTCPCFTSQNRESRLATVLLPPPEGPTRASIRFLSSVKETSCSTSFSPYAKVTFRNSTSGAPPALGKASRPRSGSSGWASTASIRSMQEFITVRRVAWL